MKRGNIGKLANDVWTRFWSSTLARRFASGFCWLTLGAVLSRVAALLATIWVARILGRDGYGELSLTRQTVAAFVALASFGMGRTATKYIAELLVVDKERVGRIVALNYLFSLFSSVVVAVVYCAAAPFLCEKILGAARLVPQVRLSAALLITSAFVGTQAGVLSGFQAFRQLSIATAVAGFATIPFYALGARFGGVSGALVGFTAASFVNCAINGYFIFFRLKHSNIKYRFAECWRELGVIWRFCLPSTLAALSTSFVAWGYSALLVREPNGFGEMAIFDAARQIQTVALYVPNLAVQILLPILTEINATNDKALYARTVKYNVALNAAFAGGVALVAVVFAVPIMRSFGEGFGEGATTLTIMAATGVVISVCNVCGSVLTSWGTIWTSFFLNSLWGATVLGGAWFASRREAGALGLAWALFFAYLVHLALCGAFMARIFRRGVNARVRKR